MSLAAKIATLNVGINTYFISPTESNVEERKQKLNDQETGRKSLNVAGDEEVTDHNVRCEFF